MGIGNLQRVLDLYDGGHAVPYPQLYFDTAPDHNSAAYALISGFGDDSSLYYWRLLGAQQIMRLYRTDRTRAETADRLQTAPTRTPPCCTRRTAVHPFAEPDALDRAYAALGRSCRCPRTPARLGLRYDPEHRLACRRSGVHDRRFTAGCARPRSTS